MQTIDLKTFKGASADGKRELALMAYQSAKSDPVFAHWESVSYLLAQCVPAPKKRKAVDVADCAPPQWWADYEPKGKRTVRTSIEVTFADGRTVRGNVTTQEGKPFNIGRGLRSVIAYYRSKIYRAVGCPAFTSFPTFGADGRELPAWDSHVTVPDMASVTCLDTGATFDPADCSRMTADMRAGLWRFPSDGGERTGAEEDALRESYRETWQAQARARLVVDPEVLAERVARVQAEIGYRAERRRLVAWLADAELRSDAPRAFDGSFERKRNDYEGVAHAAEGLDRALAESVRLGERELARLTGRLAEFDRAERAAAQAEEDAAADRAESFLSGGDPDDESDQSDCEPPEPVYSDYAEAEPEPESVVVPIATRAPFKAPLALMSGASVIPFKRFEVGGEAWRITR